MKRIFLLICFLTLIFIGVCFAQNNPISQDTSSDHWLETFASAFLGGIMAILAAWIAFKWQTGKEQKNEDEFNLRVLGAICHEIKILQAIYDNGSGQLLKEHKAGTPFFHWLNISQQHFIVYESNAEHIGKIDSELAKRIITIYATMKVMVENFGVNSHYIASFEKANSFLQQNPKDPIFVRNKEFFWNQLIQQAELLKKVDNQLLIAANDLFAEFDKIKCKYS
jgi:hypothetical protein